MKNKVLISIVGPTAIGKTGWGIKIAEHFNTEIISADSRQFYKEMTIGTAVPSNKELDSVPHHFIQHKSITEKYTVGDFEREAINKLQQLFNSYNIVLMVGGSGLYVDAVIEGLDSFPEINPSIRNSLNLEFEKNGIVALQNKLAALDPIYYKQVDRENPHRIIRALEICIGTGKRYSSFLQNEKKQRFFKSVKIGLDAPREIIYDRINKRVDKMIAEGLIKEAKDLEAFKGYNALNTVGYKELFSYFEERSSLEEAIFEIKKNTRRFAKRQLTWFRKDSNIHWIAFDAPQHEIISNIEASLRQ